MLRRIVLLFAALLLASALAPAQAAPVQGSVLLAGHDEAPAQAAGDANLSLDADSDAAFDAVLGTLVLPTPVWRIELAPVEARALAPEQPWLALPERPPR